jgi:hypothetical protein
MEHPAEIIALGATGGIIGIIIFSLFKYCYKKELHTKCRSHCCETNLDVLDNSSPVK